MVLLSNLSFFSFSLGVLSIRKRKAPVFQRVSLNISYSLALILFAISVFYFIVYRNSLGKLPIEGLFGKGNDFALMRSNATNNFSGKLFVVNLFTTVIPQYLLIISFFKRGVLKWKYLFYFLFVFSVFVALSTLEKGPVIKLLLLYLILKMYNNETRLNWKTLVMYGFAVFGLLYTMYYLIMGFSDRHLSDFFAVVFHRIFVSQIASLYWYLQYVSEFGLLWGKSFPNPAGILPFDSFPVAVRVVEIYKPGVSESGVVGSMPTVFFGDWYVNFGYVGVVIGSYLFGLLIQLIDSYFLRKRSITLRMRALHVYLILFFTKYSATSNLGIFVDYSFVVPILLTFIFGIRWKRKIVLE